MESGEMRGSCELFPLFNALQGQQQQRHKSHLASATSRRGGHGAPGWMVQLLLVLNGVLTTMRVELIGHVKPCMTEIYLHI